MDYLEKDLPIQYYLVTFFVQQIAECQYVDVFNLQEHSCIKPYFQSRKHQLMPLSLNRLAIFDLNALTFKQKILDFQRCYIFFPINVCKCQVCVFLLRCAIILSNLSICKWGVNSVTKYSSLYTFHDFSVHIVTSKPSFIIYLIKVKSKIYLLNF